MKISVSPRKTAAAAACALIALTTAGCLQDPDTSDGAGPGGSGVADGGTSDGDEKVVIMGAFGGGEQAAFEESLKGFADESGIEIDYVSDKDIATTIKQKAASGDTPDIALFPQPGGLLELAADGDIQPIDTYLDYNTLKKTLVPGFLDAVNLNGRIYGAPMRMAVKSLVFYNNKTYTQAGYAAEPKTLEELAAIGDEMKAAGASPWCMGWADAQATGWVGTDWIEEFVLRLWGPDVYDEWVAHEIPFNDDRIIAAFDAFKTMTLASGQSFGNSRGVLNTPFGDSFNPAFEASPKCYLHRQGNFILGFLPDAVTADLDSNVGLFVFPPAADGFAGQPILGGGDLAALFNGNDEDAIRVMEFLTSDKFGVEWAQAGGWLSPHRTFDANNYPDAITKKIAEIVANADVFRFDASDLMPKEVGSDTFWTGMVALANGDSAQQVTTDIENSWPTE
ncbi:MAG TPA: ABC transporter substrate-binding protein [Nocardioidaceae bacterium]|nr:ABC transporter substrate-binding protein [Nocardioidaceae bacterium]